VSPLTLEAALRTELSSISGLSGKIFPLRAPESSAAPYLVYVSSDGRQYRTLEGFVDSKEVSFDLHVLDREYSTLKALTAAILSLLRSFQGRVIGASGPFIQAVYYNDPTEVFEPEVGLYRCTITVNIEQ
jgi:hypothetical protein